MRLAHRLCARALALLIVLSAVIATPAAHAFLVQQLDAERVELSSFTGAGRWTLVMVWATDCIPCEQQKPMIETFYQDYAQGQAQVVGLVLDGIEELDLIEQMIDTGKTSFPNFLVFSDVFAGQFLEETGKPFRATPTYLLYDPSGAFAGVHVGPVSREQLDSIVAGG